MEAKLKTQRVADLRELLQKASVSIPAKANKADLIAKILASPAAIEAFNNPGSTATAAAAASKPKAPETSQAGQDDDLLAPPEEFDWGPATSNGAQGSPEAPATSAPKADSKPAASKPAVTTKESTEQPAAKPAASTGAGATGVSQDEELEKRKRRAARFNIPLVETKPKAIPASNGPKTPRSAPTGKNLSTEEVARIEARAARFGMPKIANSAANATTVTATPAATTTATATTGKKRARSPAPVDKEEMEKRQRRAERFASGGETKAQT